MAEAPDRKQFTPAEVLHIRGLWDSGRFTAREIALMYGKAAETIARIGRRETYAWLPEGQGAAESPTEGASESLERILNELKGEAK